MTARIRILPDETVNRVAAGEVVERPAAALKELLENSLDAGATRVDIALERSGKGLIRVADDGCGMGPDDALLALERHATSKIAGVEDLAHIASLGFRGEALPSIAAVSRLRILTRARGEREGTRIDVDGGRIVGVSPAGCPEGTEIEIRDLFHTVPARLKFLRSDPTELAHCLAVASRLALAAPGFALTLHHGNRELLRLSAATEPGARLREHLGRDFFSGLIRVRAAAGDIALEGYVSRPGAGRPGAEYQQFFVNGRPVRDPLLLQGVKEACRDYFLQEGAGAAFFLWISLPPGEIDVNVHPTKREVRFRDLPAVRRVLGDALRNALREDRTAWFRGSGIPSPSPAPSPPRVAEASPPGYARGSAAPAPHPPLPFDAEALPAPAAVSSGGQLFATYLVSLLPEALVITDQHAAHERILYERILARPPGSGSQQLLHPVPMELAPGEEDLLQSLRKGLSEIGVEAEPFGPRAWRILSLPAELGAEEAAAFVRELMALVRQGELAPRVAEFRHRAAAVLACHAAVRANRRLGAAEAAALLADLARTENPAACPHGRPTSITIDRAEIEKRFKRT